MQNIVTNIKANWKSGITVALVSIPLSVSLAVASGTSPSVGIITAVWAGLFASVFGGSNFNIVGPTGALSGMLAAYAIMHGADMLPMLALVTGVFVLISYFFKLERYLVLIPGSTVHGFTLGVAFIIGLNQFNFATGISGLTQHPHFIDNVVESFTHISEGSLAAFLVFVLFLFALFLITKYLKKIPAVIALAPIGIGLGYVASKGMVPFVLQTLGQKFPTMSSAIVAMPKFSFDSSLIIAGLTVAVVAILETMISAKIADVMTKTKHEKRKEMFGLGLANIASGLAGGIPATAALARTALNIKSKSNNKMSATVSSIAIALVSLLVLKYFAFIPLAVIAAILVFVAVRMIEVEHFKRMFAYNRRDFYLALVVAFVTIYEDPIVGILVGVAISLLFFVEKLSHGHFELIINSKDKKIVDRIIDDKVDEIRPDSHTVVYSIKGQLSYINMESHVERFENKLHGADTIIIRLRELYHMDLEGVEAFDEIIHVLKRMNKKVLITGVNPLIEKILETSHTYKELKKSHLVFDRTRSALVHLGYN